jgi:uncharacterized protein
MNCPKCASPMLKVNFEGVEVDNCTSCHGIFFDAFEKEQLQRMKGAEAIDFGEPEVGRRFNKVDQINCPRCGSRMIRMVDFDQPHIWFEYCTVCGGSFFDAGEFKDLKHHTLVDFFKDLLVKERRSPGPREAGAPSANTEKRQR